MLMPRKLYFSVRTSERKHTKRQHGDGSESKLAQKKEVIFISFTHVECDGDDVKAHRRVRDAAEGGRLAGEKRRV